MSQADIAIWRMLQMNCGNCHPHSQDRSRLVICVYTIRRQVWMVNRVACAWQNRGERRDMTREKLDKVLKNHMHWLRKDCDGWEDMRADLRGADLRGADLHGADLSGADLYGADLHGADLHGADLRGAYLRGADLHGAYLRGADLHGADLSVADLSVADLYGADLSVADLRVADLYGADLHGADLSGADLSVADLSGAYLRGADLSGAENIPYIPMTCPDTGSFTAWKKDGTGKLIIKLLIPDDAKRMSATGRKCRCDKAQVLAIENLDGTPSNKTETYSVNDRSFVYKVGETVTSKEAFCEDRWNECSSGIHFFINRQEAVEY